ncbi:MAG: hypothetical protein AMXMBFR84_50470 [Candidatus Hydrogenedentota bacterium]
MDNPHSGTPPETKTPSYYRKGFVLLLLFTTTGVLGLPLLYKSPYFSRGEKRFWAVLTTLWTLTLIIAAATTVWWAAMSIMRALSMS